MSKDQDQEKGTIHYQCPMKEKRRAILAARDLGLPLAELMRRAARIALPVLTGVKYPGVSQNETEATDGR